MNYEQTHVPPITMRTTAEMNTSILVNAAQNAAQAQSELTRAGRQCDRATRAAARSRLEESIIGWSAQVDPNAREQEHTARVALAIFDATVAP